MDRTDVGPDEIRSGKQSEIKGGLIGQRGRRPRVKSAPEAREAPTERLATRTAVRAVRTMAERSIPCARIRRRYRRRDGEDADGNGPELQGDLGAPSEAA